MSSSVTKGLLVRLEGRLGFDEEVENFLRSALPLVEQEPGTSAWFAIRFGHAEYGIFDVFPDEAARDAHLSGAVAKALMAHAEEILDKPPSIEKVTILASKLPVGKIEPVTKALLLTFKAKEGHEKAVEEFLQAGRAIVEEEPGTTAWFAIQLDNGHYGVFDVFPDKGARFAHLAGEIPRELAKHALTLLGSMPDPEMITVVAQRFR